MMEGGDTMLQDIGAVQGSGAYDRGPAPGGGGIAPGPQRSTAPAEGTERSAKVVVNGLTKRFGKLLVLDDISFTVGEGEFLSIVGPTGCGKTTFLNLLSRLIPATAGGIYIDGQEADPKRHHIAFVFQEPSSMPWRTVRDNIAYGMEVKRVPREIQEARLQKILELVGLTDSAHLYPNQISASMEQRVAVARAFATQPDLLLMDEPYGQLDVKLRCYLEDELIRLWQELKSTVIFVTHNIEEAVYVAQRILVLTNKPTKVKAEVKVDLPRPRSVVDPAFVEIRRAVTELIRWW
jgi:sulfonate transport system ATP-binding protein